MCLIGLALLTVINLFGIAESARFLMLPTLVFIISIFAVIVLGAFHPHPVAVIGKPERFPAVAVMLVGLAILIRAHHVLPGAE